MMKVTPRVSFIQSKNSLIGMSHVMSTPRTASGMFGGFDAVNLVQLLELKLRWKESFTLAEWPGVVE